MRSATTVGSALFAGSVVAAFLAAGSCQAGELDRVLAPISPEIRKWASVCRVTEGENGPKFHWDHFENRGDHVDFWPASTIKVYTAIAALEHINEAKIASDCTVTFESKREGQWVLDSSRTLKEMISEVFRRSSNEDYTLLLRMVGIDRINRKFLIPEKGFPHSALMRGYVLHRPCVYRRDEPQRISIRARDGRQFNSMYTWSGHSYAQERGATVLSATTGNCTSTHELTECLRRIFFHEHLPESERFNLNTEQLQFLREGGNGWTGLRNQEAGAFAWKGSTEKVFPNAKYYHKGGRISTYTLDTAYIHDPETNIRFFLTVAAKSGKAETVTSMARAIAEWVKERK